MKTLKTPFFEVEGNFPEVNSQKISTAWNNFKEKTASKQIGFFDWPQEISKEEIETIEKLTADLRKNFEGALVIGIGGSYVGPLTIYENLGDKENFPLYWLSNIDPGEIESLAKVVAKKKLATIVISKSGGTLETLSGFFHFAKTLDPKGYVMITDPKEGELRKFTNELGWKSLSVSPNIGGRFSVLTSVGLLPASLCGVNVRALISGAENMRSFLNKEANNPAVQLASFYHSWNTEAKKNIFYFMPYQKSLRFFAEWLVQLFGESLGKNRKGFTPVSALGTTDQHSILQLLKEGPLDKVVSFINLKNSHSRTIVGKPPFSSSQAYLFSQSFESISYEASRATQLSLNNAEVLTYRVEIDRLTPEVLGALFFFFETVCAVAGEFYQVNAFDQPGVEEAKQLLRSALKN